MEEKSFSVSQIGGYIKQIFDAEELLHDIKVFGEISEFKISQGNAWFSIKDENATLSCALFGANYLEFIPKVGESVIIKGSPSYWVKSGKLAFVAKKIEHLGEGELYLKFLALKEKLEKEGLFDSSRKKSVPSNAINIGVATSQTGAVMHDIITVATRRNPAVNIFISPCKVQGQDADLSIIESLKILDNMNLDVIIVGRGGGSKEDLDCFNSEKLARFIASMKTPTVSAVGHETDFTICDFVCDKRAPTPSAGAELVVANVLQYAQDINNKMVRLNNIITGYINDYFDVIETHRRQLNTLLNVKISEQYSMIKANKELLISKMKHYYSMLQAKFEGYVNVLDKLNPLKIISSGYAQVENQNGSVKSISQTQKDDVLNISLIDGVIITKVLNIEKRGK